MFIHTLPEELRNSRKDLINMMNRYKQCFRWCHIRDLNLMRKNPQPIKYLIASLDCEDIEFAFSKKGYVNIAAKNNKL